MKFYETNPECPAGFGGVEWDGRFDPPRQISAHLTFAVPVRAELITSYGAAFAVTEPLAEALSKTDLTGFEFGPVTSSLKPDIEDDSLFEVPPLRGLIITGKAFADDFGIEQQGLLILSEKAVELLTSRDSKFRNYIMEPL
ncbi:hypothetical protein [Nocardia noduli]|uniref:hypothetical protein n=1 Tax=Nocardia noduli TaxID=2815722 RepID=UPI001C24D4A4|nr:hypothetical protein [Nocardia noduli]